MDLSILILPDPERLFGPRESRVTTAARCGDSGEHTAGFWIDFLDATFGELEQMLPVEGGSRTRGDIDRADRFAACRIERVQRISRGKPHVPAVIRHAMHLVNSGKGSVFADDFGGCGGTLRQFAAGSTHAPSLV